MFQTVAIIVFLATLGGIIVHCFAFPAGPKRGEGAKGTRRGIARVFSLLLIERKDSLLGILKKLCYLVAALCFLVLALTGFWPLLVRGQHISGYLMMIHATFAPVFAICLAIIALTWAGGYRFEKDDCPWLWRFLRRVTKLQVPTAEGPCKWSLVIQKAMFWSIAALSLPLILSIILSMFPLFGTHWQEILLAAHRWTAIVFAVAVVIHTYLAARIQMAQ